MIDIDADKATVIARKFFAQSFDNFELGNVFLQGDDWVVKGLVTLFGLTSNRILTVDSKTGNIVSCEYI
ncbi:MAG TPA: hypothetical protein VGR54_06370 [Nitrosopumilaceae archaeon]|nr:hypothetical protein [Nitrosopumilaceae archaeon]